MSMLNVIDFLEECGADAQLRHASTAELSRALAGAQIDPFVRKALLGADRRHLQFLVGARPNVCCLIFSPKEDAAEGDVRKPGENDKVKKAEDRVRRIA
jgi:hypothetical protein